MNKAIKTVLGGVLFVVIVIGLWNLFDFIWKTWINGSGYLFSSSYHILLYRSRQLARAKIREGKLITSYNKMW